ncbi:MAG: site-specific DNA-methyltransferase [Elusimicrobia bacterium]|nr:site-specific DNA-methyltransferase [Elusimicrobiota bacterium]
MKKQLILKDEPSLIIENEYNKHADVVLFPGNCLDLLKTIPDNSIQLVVTSPPYNIGKAYEKRTSLDRYLAEQEKVIGECVRVLSEKGSLCWQVGNHIKKDGIVPLDIALYPILKKFNLKLRNRIIWHFEHGLHCSKRFSGRYETICWFTKSDRYFFNLDPVRIPQKYPSKKYFKGPKAGQLSCNPLGKNPGDLWIIPNVKHNHVEKTIHPCQFPVELIERLILSLTNPGNYVLDPFMGVGTTAVASILNKRKSIGAEIVPEYLKIAKERINLAYQGRLRIRPMNQPVYDPNKPQKNRTNLYTSYNQFGDSEELPLFPQFNFHNKEDLIHA